MQQRHPRAGDPQGKAEEQSGRCGAAFQRIEHGVDAFHRPQVGVGQVEGKGCVAVGAQRAAGSQVGQHQPADQRQPARQPQQAHQQPPIAAHQPAQRQVQSQRRACRHQALFQKEGRARGRAHRQPKGDPAPKRPVFQQFGQAVERKQRERQRQFFQRVPPQDQRQRQQPGGGGQTGHPARRHAPQQARGQDARPGQQQQFQPPHAPQRVRGERLPQGKQEVRQGLFVVPGAQVGRAAFQQALAHVEIHAGVIRRHRAKQRRDGQQNHQRQQRRANRPAPAAQQPGARLRLSGRGGSYVQKRSPSPTSTESPPMRSVLISAPARCTSIIIWLGRPISRPCSRRKVARGSLPSRP